ncbi:MAG: hypothetical protein CM15mP45_14060 [Deltaproteobacteria bacterium]|nr:MAG: hypothetical protein CM15mP45_14060 [Deltaproteobacteria bacterium]
MDVIPLIVMGLKRKLQTRFGFFAVICQYINGQIIPADGGFDPTGIGLTSLRHSKIEELFLVVFIECLIKRSFCDCGFFVGNYWRMRVSKSIEILRIFLTEKQKYIS